MSGFGSRERESAQSGRDVTRPEEAQAAGDGAFTEKVVDDPDALIGAFDTAAALMHRMRSKSRRRPKAVTLQQVLKSVAMILVFHLSGFDYRKEQASPRARTARMLAALTVVLADTVIPEGVP